VSLTRGSARSEPAAAGSSPAVRASGPAGAPRRWSSPRPFIDQLRAHREAQDAERLAAGDAWTDLDLVFCSPTGGPVSPEDDREDWLAVLDEAGVRLVRVHDARHTAASLLLAQGVHIRVVQQILGHSQISQTQRYTHVTSELVEHAAARMSEALWE
jgi:site-specific recombinase XerD